MLGKRRHVSLCSLALTGFCVTLGLLYLRPLSLGIPSNTVKTNWSAGLTTYLPSIGTKEHPILTISKAAARKHEQKIAHQSGTYEQAVTEYSRRYGRLPPPHFEHWFAYAKAVSSPIIDDYDVLDDAISPLLRSSGAEILRAMDSPNARAWMSQCKIENGRLQPGCECLGDVTLRLFADARVIGHLPDVEILINQFDEPRILLDAKRATSIRSRHQRRESEANGIEWRDLHQRNVWQELVVDQCRGSEAPQRSHPDLVSLSSEHKVFGLVQDNFNSLALCDHKDWEHAHGIWESATSLQVTRSPLPVLSAAVISTMNDIPFPAGAYTNGAYAYDEAEVVEYENKSHALYWAGKTTGGLQDVTATDWVPLHRQRFVSLANDQDAEAQTFLRREKENGLWKLVSGSLNKTMFNVHFTDVLQCTPDACEVQRKYFEIIEPEPRKKALKYTLVFDADGNGHSARYYRFVQSRSLPLKQTVFREWHDDRLQPWLHYIPISLEMTELPEVVRYFVEEEEGRALAKELALAGREWAQKSLRPEDQVVYLYRLLLELARLQDPVRPASK
ncbi:hypothetical protein BST61_g6938 [Cercospora zeina]